MKNIFSREDLYGLAWGKPVLAQIEISGNCNQHCLHCFRGHREPVVVQDLPFSSWQLMLNKLFRLGVRRLDFTGSESFLHPELARILEWTKGKGFENRINTNGTIDVEPVLKFADEIIFSVHGLGSIHNKIVGNRGAFGLVENNIFRTSKSDTRVSINMSLFKSNYHQMLNVYRHFDSRYNLHSFSPTIPVSSRYGNSFGKQSLAMNRALVADYLSKLGKINRDKLVLKHGFHSIFINDQRHYRGENFPLPNCAAGKYKLIVDHDGSVYPCNFFRGEEFFCGNLLHNDEADVWKNGRGFKKFRSLVLDERLPGKCNSCLKKAKCFSGCRAWAEHYRKGGFYENRDSRCAIGSAFIRS
jgi:radical SAM protein with 4Fe4S-binding SPASM domain